MWDGDGQAHFARYIESEGMWLDREFNPVCVVLWVELDDIRPE